MPQFLEQFPKVSEAASGGGLYKGLMTAMIELGALIGEPSHSFEAHLQIKPSDTCYRCSESRLDCGQNLSKILDYGRGGNFYSGVKSSSRIR